MFYPISKVIWLVAAPTNALILITAATTVWASLRVSKWAAWLAAISACTLVIGSFTPVGYWLMSRDLIKPNSNERWLCTSRKLHALRDACARLDGWVP